jgi:hypothetical protein
MGLGSGIRDPEKKTYSGSESRVKKAPDPGSASATLMEGKIIPLNSTYQPKKKI